ncbi:MAG: response regulator [Thermodesulfobacteriota bacterium]
MNGKPTILVVDDSVEAVAMVREMLLEAGYLVRAAANGEEALAAVDAEPPDLILLDLCMPGLNGLDVCQALQRQKRPGEREIPVILISGYAEVGDWVQGLQGGAADYIRKPFRGAELVMRVATHLELNRVKDAIARQEDEVRRTHQELYEEIAARRRAEDELRRSLDRAERSRMALLSSLEDQAEIAENLRAANARLQAMWSVSSLTNVDIKSVSDHILATLTEMTSSEFGFYGFVNDDESAMTIHAWSGMAMSQCAMADKPSRFPIDAAGLWGEAVRRREPLIVNDYGAPHSGKKGLPAGHVPLRNLLVVPFFCNNRITSLAAVANRRSAGGYDNDDVTQITSLLASVNAVVEAKRAEEKVRQSEELYRGLFESMGQGVIYRAMDGSILAANPAAQAIVGASIDRMREDPDYDPMRRAIREDGSPLPPEEHPDSLVLRSGIPSGPSVLGILPDVGGAPRWLSISTSPLFRQGEIVPYQLYSIFSDITATRRAQQEKERLRQQLEQAQKLESVGRLAGGVAHDYNNMLSVIMGNAELLLDEVDSSWSLRSAITEIIKAAERSRDVTRQLLAFARKQTVEPVLLDLNEAVEGMLKMLRRLIGEDIKLSWQPGGNLGRIRIDPSQIDQILANVCVNARDAIAGVGNIAITTENVMVDQEYCSVHAEVVPGEYVRLSVSDSGGGMSEETRANIFEPFFTTKEVGKGTGLGLATVYGIVKQNQGFISVYTEMGMGSVFNFYFPRCAHEDKGGGVIDGKEEIPCGNGETILLVEDEQPILAMGHRMLVSLGYRVLAASSPVAALALAVEHAGSVRLLVSDVVMPEMNGRDLVNRMQEVIPGLRYIFMSGYTADVISRQGVLAQGLQFIQKPFSKKDLAKKVREVLDEE